MPYSFIYANIVFSRKDIEKNSNQLTQADTSEQKYSNCAQLKETMEDLAKILIDNYQKLFDVNIDIYEA